MKNTVTVYCTRFLTGIAIGVTLCGLINIGWQTHRVYQYVIDLQTTYVACEQTQCKEFAPYLKRLKKLTHHQSQKSRRNPTCLKSLNSKSKILSGWRR